MAPSTRARARRVRPLPAALALVALVALGPACRRDAGAPGPATPATAAAPAAPGPELATTPAAAPPRAAGPARLRKVTTGVFRVAAGGAATRARDGEPLAAGDGLRTTWGNAEVVLPDGAVVRVDERTELRVVALDAAGPRLALVRGRVSVDPARAGGIPARVELPAGSPGAAAIAGRWSALATPSTLAVAAARAPVRLESAGAAVEVPPGAAASAAAGRPPAAPVRTPRPLTAAAEPGQVPPAVCAVVHGGAAPGSEVRVAGAAVDLAEDGSFAVTVPRAGRSAVDIAVRHASGAVERRSVPCAEAALSAFEVEWDDR